MLLGGIGRHLLATAWNVTASTSLRGTSQYTGTFILKRRNAPLLSKRNHPEGSHRPLRRRHMIYDTVSRPGLQALPSIDVILTQYVEGVGKPGDLISVKVTQAHNDLLSMGRAVYASPENVERYRELAAAADAAQEQHSSIYSAQTAKTLAKRVINISMNLREPWTLEPWHVRVAFRKAGVMVPESCMTLPAQPVSGPDLEGLEGREFIVTVTINRLERVPVRCRIHHFASDPADRLPWTRQPWLRPAEPLFEEQRHQLAAMPRPTTQLQ